MKCGKEISITYFDIRKQSLARPSWKEDISVVKSANLNIPKHEISSIARISPHPTYLFGLVVLIIAEFCLSAKKSFSLKIFPWIIEFAAGPLPCWEKTRRYPHYSRDIILFRDSRQTEGLERMCLFPLPDLRQQVSNDASRSSRMWGFHEIEIII